MKTTIEDLQRDMIEYLEDLSIQLESLTHTIDVLQSSFEIKHIDTEVIASLITLNHAINNIRAENDIKISDIADIQ